MRSTHNVPIAHAYSISTTVEVEIATPCHYNLSTLQIYMIMVNSQSMVIHSVLVYGNLGMPHKPAISVAEAVASQPA